MPTSSSPNVIIIMTDQQRADLCGREGFALDTTPFVDSLAAGGAWFDRAYTSMPVCAPARVSMLTGRYPSATRVRTNHNIEDARYAEDLFDVFRGLGYGTAMIGKNHSRLSAQNADEWYECGHLGINDPERTEQERHFDAFLEQTHFHLWPQPTPFPVECQIPYRLVSRAQRWLDSISDRPFLMWLSFPEPHNPYQAPEPYYSMFAPESIPEADTGADAIADKGFKYAWCRESFERAFPDYVCTIRRARANYMGMLRLIDDQIGRLIEFVRERHLAANTIVVILSDHGDFVGEYGLLRKGPELPELLTRIPLVFSGPGIAPNRGPRPEHVSIVDILPTLCEAVGASLPDGVQGRSLWPLLSGEDYPKDEFSSAYVEHGFGGLHYTGEESLDPTLDGFTPSSDGQWGGFDCLNSRTQSGQLRAVRKGDWKLTYDMQGTARLHNLRSDPRELVDLYSDPASQIIRQELLEEMLTWALRVQDQLPLPRRRYVMKRDPRGYWTR